MNEPILSREAIVYRRDCVITSSHKDKDGYGRVKSRELGNSVGEHRLAYCTHHKLPLSAIKGLIVRHRCDNPPWVNPMHLTIGTHADNIRDRDDRGHTAKGVRNSQAKLSEEDVLFIRANYRSRDRVLGSKALSARFGVSPSTVIWIISGGTWRHLKCSAPGFLEGGA